MRFAAVWSVRYAFSCSVTVGMADSGLHALREHLESRHQIRHDDPLGGRRGSPSSKDADADALQQRQDTDKPGVMYSSDPPDSRGALQHLSMLPRARFHRKSSLSIVRVDSAHDLSCRGSSCSMFSLAIMRRDLGVQLKRRRSRTAVSPCDVDFGGRIWIQLPLEITENRLACCGAYRSVISLMLPGVQSSFNAARRRPHSCIVLVVRYVNPVRA